MIVQSLVFLVAPLLSSPTADTPDRLRAGEAVVLEGRYGSSADGRSDLRLAVRHTTGRFELGWQLAWRRYGQGDPLASGDRVTLGPLWAWSPLEVGPFGLRLRLDPWVAISTRVREKASNAVVSLPYGGESQLALYASVRLGHRVQLVPSAALTGSMARCNRAIEKTVKGWDEQLGWRLSITASLGARQRLRIETACSHSWQPTSYGAQDGCELSAGWRF